MKRPTMADLLITSRTAASAAPWFFVRKLVDLPVPASLMERYHKAELGGYGFILVLSDLPASTLNVEYKAFVQSSELTVIFITPDTPIGVAASLALLATAAIVHSSVDMTPDEATAVAAVITSRGAPLIAVDKGNTIPPIIMALADGVYESADEAVSELTLRNRSAKFPCLIQFTEQGMAIIPNAPMDFFSAYEQGTPMFDMGIQRMTMLVMKARDSEIQFDPQKRYYIVLVGDLPMAIEDEAGDMVFSMFQVKPAVPKASSPHN